ncbi:MAG TPA: phosphoribosylanthranilate isomerase [Terriglobia bacterium]|nr:phosphoribosylanthranilate isomerase [Terriglobia bacterium]
MTRVKICGITRLEDAELTMELGALALGFNFYRGSPRYIAPEAAREIIRRAVPPLVMAVGVFADETDAERIIAVARESGVSAIQLHGPRLPAFARRDGVRMAYEDVRDGEGRGFSPAAKGADSVGASAPDAISEARRAGATGFQRLKPLTSAGADTAGLKPRRSEVSKLHSSKGPKAFPEPVVAWPYPLIRAVTVDESFEPASLQGLAQDDADVILLDAFHPALKGGTGRTIDWAKAREATKFARVILAGGLTPENVGEAIRQVRPFAVDVASGVEAAPGLKDASKLRAFFAAVREADDI